MKRTMIGGQAVMEGVMMKNLDNYAVAVRKPDHEIEIMRGEYVSLTKRHAFCRLPIVRGVVSFGVTGGREAAGKFMAALKLAAIETHVADARTCCLHPASSTHRQMSEEELIAAGVPGDLVRLSCGLESKEDLIEDLAQALDKI